MIGLRDIKAKYKQAALGPLWLVLAPLGLLAAVTVAFSGVTDVQTYGIPYLIFALPGLTVWSFFQLSLTVGSQAVIGNAPLVRRSPLPRVALMTGTLLGNMPSLLLMVFYTVVSAAIFYNLPLQALLFPLMFAWLIVLTLALTLVVGSLSARFRDAATALPLVIQAGLFVTPVGYGLEQAPAHIHTLLMLNPLTGLIEAWRWCLIDLPNPSVTAIVISVSMTVGFAVAGWRLFGRMEVEFADYV
jgi:ABC-type polysaccharide/polyol phosphate export permease